MIIMGSLIRGQVCSAPRWQRVIGTCRKEGRRNRRTASQGRAGQATRGPGRVVAGRRSRSFFFRRGTGYVRWDKHPGGPGRKMFCFFFCYFDFYYARRSPAAVARAASLSSVPSSRGADGRTCASASAEPRDVSVAREPRQAGGGACRSLAARAARGGWHVYTAGGVTRLGGCRAQSPTAARGLLAGWSLVARAGLPKIL